ncbi:MAG: hypothetical protein Q7R87_01000 [Nanoarchaeota archaeon]|nr:hypothetical protein [Nanoarchaeota archaeon]
MARELDVGTKFIDDFTRKIINHLVAVKELSISLEMREIKKHEIDSLTSDIDRDYILKKKIVISNQLSQKQRLMLPKPLLINPVRQISSNNMNPIKSPINKIPGSVSQDNSLDNQPSLNKIVPFLKDKIVQSIECKGPGRPLLVLKGGIIQVTNTILTKEEIDLIMEQISNETRIPLMSGLFKALLGNVIITAAISEFVGTRFIIEKRRDI